MGSPHPKFLSHREKNFEILLPFSHWEKGLEDVSVAARSAGCSSTCFPGHAPVIVGAIALSRTSAIPLGDASLMSFTDAGLLGTAVFAEIDS